MARSRRNRTLINRKRSGGWGWGWLTRARNYLPSLRRNTENKPFRRGYSINNPEPAKEGYFTRKFSNLKSYFSRGRHHSAPKGSPPKGSPQKALSPKKGSEEEEREFKEDERDKFVQLFLDYNDRRERSRLLKINYDNDVKLIEEMRKIEEPETEFKPPPDGKERQEFYLKIYKAMQKEEEDLAKKDRDYKKKVEDELALKYEPAREEFNKLFDIYYRQTHVPGVSRYKQGVDKDKFYKQLEEGVDELREKYGFTGRQ